VLLLAPTGKARVRMEQATSKLGLKGFTIAQFLKPHRYDSETGRYVLSDKRVDVGARTVIIDESSMLTEEMLGALIQALKGVHRLILIGDPRQLPPIGAGRPFVDIVNHLAPDGITERLPRVGPGYAELVIRMRQVGEDREDLQLAEWFSGAPIAPGEDDVFDKVVSKGESKHVRFVQWNSPDGLRTSLIEVLVQELKLKGPEDIVGFDATLGGVDWNGMRFYNYRSAKGPGAAEVAEGWQIVSPVRTGTHGVPDLNRAIHERFRKEMVAASYEVGRQYQKARRKLSSETRSSTSSTPIRRTTGIAIARSIRKRKMLISPTATSGSRWASSGKDASRRPSRSARTWKSSSLHSQGTSTRSLAGTSARKATRSSSWPTP
jgi:hypothetical protein